MAGKTARSPKNTKQRQTVAPAAKAKEPTVTTSETIITTAEAGAEDLETKVNQLSARLDKQIDKQHSDQRNIFIGVLLAVVLIVATVAAEVIMFNANYDNGLDELRKQHQEDYRSLRDTMDSQRDTINQQLLELKLNQPQDSQQ